MANVYSAEAKLEQGKTPKAAQLKEHAFRFYLKAFAAKRDKEFFLPMFVMAISEGPGMHYMIAEVRTLVRL